VVACSLPTQRGGPWRSLPPWVAEKLAEKFREITVARYEMHHRIEFKHDDYGTGLQARVEAALLQAMLKEQVEAQAAREWRERVAAEQEANALRQREQEEERRRQWEGERPECQRLERERREKREAEEVARRVSEEAEAGNLNWDGQSARM
jgi:hypothetical protein